jgi:hypothetical protein
LSHDLGIPIVRLAARTNEVSHLSSLVHLLAGATVDVLVALLAPPHCPVRAIVEAAEACLDVGAGAEGNVLVTDHAPHFMPHMSLAKVEIAMYVDRESHFQVTS